MASTTVTPLPSVNDEEPIEEEEEGEEEEDDETLNIPDIEQAIVTVETKEGVLNESLDTVDTDDQETVTPRVSGNRELVYRDRETNVSYEIQHGSSKRGRDKLIDSLGFTYNCKPLKSASKTTTWTCSVRNARLRCPATVLQRGNVFLRGMKKHSHLLGQKFPKPEQQTPGSSQIKRKQPRWKKNIRARHKGNQDYQLIKNGSKSGMDLLRDCLGYTYTFKRSTVGGYKVFWSCSVRNKHLRCNATIMQYGEGEFVEGPHEHQHLPAYNIPADNTEEIPSLKKIREEHEADGSDMEEDDEEAGADAGNTQTEEGEKSSGATPSQSGSTYLHSGFKHGSQKRKVTMVKEKQRKKHETFLGPMCTINLSKCEDVDCSCDLVHCPFCDPLHFKPTKAGRVQDHLELTHFAHGVQYDDLMIVKCFKDCDVERTIGHYHCVFCNHQIIKRDFYARHMLRHLRSMGIPERLLMLPDSKYPDIINAYGYEIPICTKTTCLPTEEKHFHCPCCSKICLQRSLTVNHLWRCFQKQQGNTEDVSDGDEADLCNTVDEEQIILHFSHAKTIQDLPVNRCEETDCCNQMFHCVLCPEDVFIPSYKQQLLVHYMAHWKYRVPYKNFGLMRCFNTCVGVPCKSRYHYHCPICTKTIQSKATFEDHLKSCHMLRFGENLIESNTLEESITVDNDNDPVPLQISVEFLEDQLIAQSKAYSKKKSIEQKQFKKEKGMSKFNRPSMYRKPVLKQEFIKTEAKSPRRTVKMEKEVVDTSLPIEEDEIFQHCTAVLSGRCMRTVMGRKSLKSMLGDVAGQTETNLSLNDEGKYQLTGTVLNLREAQSLITQSINEEMDTEDENISDENKPMGKRSSGKKVLRAPTRMIREGDIVKKTCKALVKKGVTAAIKKGRGRPRKVSDTTETFPYSEIKEIINATKDKDNASSVMSEEEVAKDNIETKPDKVESKPVVRGRGRPPKTEVVKSPVPKTPEPAVKRGRGRPPKVSPANPAKLMAEKPNIEMSVKSDTQERLKKNVKSTPEKKDDKKDVSASTPTPKRYGTRGLRKDYAGMNSGIGINEIKQEPVEVTSHSKRDNRRQSYVATPSKKRKNEEVESAVSKRNRKDAELEMDDSTQQEDEIMEETELKDNEEEFDDIQDESEVKNELDKQAMIRQDDECYSEEKDIPETVMTEELKEVESITTPSLEETSANNLNKSSMDDSSTSSGEEKPNAVGFKVFVPVTSIVKPSDDKEEETVPTQSDSQPITNHVASLKFKCSYCDKSFAYKSNLDDHENKHTGATPYKCEICCKAFPSQSLLMKHKTLVHATIRPFKCTVCHKSFRFLNVLQSHTATHLRSRVHSCKTCSKVFSTASTLKFHMERCSRKTNKTLAIGLNETINEAFTVVNNKDGLIIYTKTTEPAEPSPGAAFQVQPINNQYALPVEIPVSQGETVPVSVETELANQEPVFAAESNVEMAGEPENVGEVELYACSECNCAFDTYQKAEAHILTAHSVVSG